MVVLSRRLLGAALAVALLTACSHDGEPPPSTQYTLSAVDAAGTGAAGTIVSLPLRVTVRDPSGAAVSGVTVRYRVTTGTGTVLRDSIAATDFDGVARGEAQLGAPGPVTITAFVRGQESRGILLNLTVSAAPTLTSVTPMYFSSGDTISVRGSGLGALGSGIGAFFGPLRGELVSLIGDTAAVVVAPACLGNGATAVRLASAAGTTNGALATTTQRATVNLRIGQGGVAPAGGAGCLALPADGGRYLVVPQFAGIGARTLTSFSLGASRTAGLQAFAATATPTTFVAGPRERFEAFLRERERVQAPMAARTAPRADAGVALEALTVGSKRTFRVINNLCVQQGGSCQLGFGSATATLKVLGAHVALYVDDTQLAGETFSDAELASFGALFDQTLYEIDVRAFGSESDIDRNGHVIVLLTPAVNGLTASTDCNSGFVAGFFFSDDLASSGGNSNKGEVFYTLAPDATGARSCAHSTASVKRLAPATFIHEFQHMISFNQHALVRGGDAEAPWLNEGLSHMAEELGSRYYEGLLPGMTPSAEGQRKTNPAQFFPDSSSDFITPDLRNAYGYLADPTNNSVTSFDDFGTLEDRGAAWLFLRWLADQKGEGILSRLVQTSRTSLDNVADKSGESFASLFNDFAIATYGDSLPGVPRAQIASRYHFAPNRNLRALFNRLATTGTVATPFPIVTTGVPVTGTITGSMLPGTMSFHTLTTPATGGAFTLLFTPSSAPTFPTALAAQVGVLRVP